MVDPKTIESYSVDQGAAIWFLGGPSLAFRSRQSLIYLDLFVGPSRAPDEVTRDIPDGIDPSQISYADYVISTHHDEDHCNEHTLKIIYKSAEAVFLGPVSCNKLYREWGFSLERTRIIGEGETLVKKDVKINALPSKDVFDQDAVCYLLEVGGVKIFEGGDTLYFEEMDNIGAQFDIDIAFLSTATNPDGEIYYMDDEQVIKAARDLDAKVVMLKHYELWKQFKKDPQPLLEKLKTEGHDARVFELGQKFIYPE